MSSSSPSNGRRLADSGIPTLLVKAALVSLCLVGIVVSVQLMTTFSSALKPLVLSTMMAGCLESFVQLTEVCLLRCWRLLLSLLCCECCPARRGNRRIGSEQLSTPLESKPCADEGTGKCLPRSAASQWGTEQPGEYFLPRLIAVAFTLTAAGLCMTKLFTELIASLQHLDLDTYKQGFNELQTGIVSIVQRTSPEAQAQVSATLTSWSDRISGLVVDVVNNLLGSLTNIFVESVMFLLYSLMWLLKPLTDGQKAFRIVRTYFMYKSFCNLVFSVLVFALLNHLHVDLTIVVALVCFFLGFIPEIGAFIALAIPVPLILFDARRTLVGRLWSLLKASIGMLAIKFAVSNGLESVLMGQSQTLAGQHREDETKVEKTHPVILLFVVVMFGEVWGATGMLRSVPVVSLIRLLINLELEQDDATERRPSELAP